MQGSRRAASWLCRTDDERGRMVDMSERLRRAEAAVIAAFGVLGVVAIPTTGPGLLAATALGALGFALFAKKLARSRRPEHLSIAVIAAGQVILAGGILASTGPRVLLLATLMGPMLIGAAVWPLRGVIAGTAASAALMVALAFAVDPSGVVHIPALLCFPLAVLVATVVVISAARGADVASRGTAMVDRLTGLLNRAALLPRAAELAHQSELTGEPVALLLGDIDHFKQVNDRHGHAKGDEALAAIAARLRNAAGAAGTLYRFGGEELVVLAPGASLAGGAQLADSLRAALARAPVAGLPITISFGVAASASGAAFDFEALFASADAALYTAKAQGRDRVCASGLASAHPSARAAAATRARAPLSPAASAAREIATAPPHAASAARAGHARSEGTEGQSRPAAPVRRHRGKGAQALADPQALADRSTRAILAARAARARAATGSWLVRDEPARAHMLDLLHRIHKVRLVAYGVVFVALASGGPAYGWWPLAPPCAGAIAMGVALERSGRMRRPELWIFAAILLSQVTTAAGFLLTRDSPYAALPLLVVLVSAWSPVFPARGVAVMAAVEVALIAGAALFIGAHATLHDPLVLGVPFVLLLAVTAIGSAMGRSSTDHRGVAVIDQLTGMLNRRALEARAAAIAHQLDYTREPAAVIVGDIDRFKQINDSAGHGAGDAVLREIAYRLRKNLRAFEAAYRIGGEEFVVLLAGAPADEATAIAERLRGAIRAAPIRGLPVTMSFGVARCQCGAEFEYSALFAHADAALYEAKGAGRDRVCVASMPAAPPSDRAAAAPLASAA